MVLRSSRLKLQKKIKGASLLEVKVEVEVEISSGTYNEIFVLRSFQRHAFEYFKRLVLENLKFALWD